MHLALYRESSDKQRDGAPIYIGDATFYVRRWGTNESQAYLKDLRRALFGPHHRSQEGDESKVIAEWLAGYGVVGWESVLDADTGEEYKYSKKNARLLFLDPEYYLSLNAELFMQANRFENYLYDEALDELEELKKKVTWDFEDMDSTFGLYAATGDQNEFYAMRPDLEPRQVELLNAFYTARREFKGDEKASSKALQEAARFCDYEPDIALMILQKLDDHLLELIADKMRKAAKK